MRVYGSYFGSLESLTFVGATPQRYKFSTTTTDSDPGDGYLRFDDSAFASVTKIFADDKNAFGVIIRDWLDRLDDGSAGRITIQNVTAAGAFRVLDVTGAVTDATGYRRVVVAPVQANGTFAEDDGVIVSFISTGGSPQPYEFSDSTSTNPPNGVLRFDHGTFASITKIYADDLSANGFDVGAWLDAIDDQADVRVTIMRAYDNTVLRIFKVNSVVNSTGYRTINVTPIHSLGVLSDGAPVVLICSALASIRDRSGALLAEQSEEGFPSGHALIQNCTFVDADDGVRLDEVTPSNNCADNTFVQCSFLGCGVGIKSNSIQVLNNTVINCDFSGCTTAIDHALGGDMRVFGSSMNGYVGDVFLKIRGGGNNASSFVVYGVRLEMKAGKPSLLETSDALDDKNVLIDGLAWTGEYPAEYSSGTSYDKGDQVRIGSTVYESIVDSNQGNTPATSPDQWRWIGDWVRPVRLSQNTNCTIRGSIVKGPFADVTGDTARATLRLDNCRLSYNQTDVVTTGTNGVYKTLDCTDGSGVPVEDTGNWPRFRIMPISRSFGTASASAAIRLPPMPAFSARVTAARLVVADGVAPSNTHYWSFRLLNKGDGSDNTDVLATSSANTTKFTGGINGGSGLAQDGGANLTLHGTTANRDVTAGQVLVFEVNINGGPDPLVDGVVEIDVEPA